MFTGSGLSCRTRKVKEETSGQPQDYSKSNGKSCYNCRTSKVILGENVWPNKTNASIAAKQNHPGDMVKSKKPIKTKVYKM